MDFNLSDETAQRRDRFATRLAAAAQPVGDDDAPAGAASALGPVLRPLAFDPNVAALVVEAARSAFAPRGTDASGGLLDAVLACEAAGRMPLARSPRPIMLLAWLARHLPDGARLDAILGETALAVEDGICEALGCQVPGAPMLGGRVRRRVESWDLTGTFDLVEGGMGARWLVAACCPWPEGRGLFLVDLAGPGIARHPVRYLDVAQPAARIDLAEAPAMPLGQDVSGELDRLGRVGRLLSAAELLGAAAEIMDRAIAYARVREQFGRPIGSFQAVSHACADMYRDVELMRSLVYAAASSRHPADVPGALDAAQAKLLALDLAGAVADRGLHVFGAEGLRWHRGLHLLVRRIKALQILFGDRDACEEAIISDWVSQAPDAGRDAAPAPHDARHAAGVA